MKKGGIALLVMWGVLFIGLDTAHTAESDADKIEALLPDPLTPSATVIEILERAERIERQFETDDRPDGHYFRRSFREVLAQAKARYGDFEGSAAVLEKMFAELDTRRLEPAEKERAFGNILIGMSRAGLASEAARKAEAHASPTVRAVAPFILGELQVMNARFEDARKSFKRTLTILKNAPESPLKNNIIELIISYACLDETMLDVILLAEECVSPNQKELQMYRFMFSQAWCRAHKADLAAGKFEMFLQRAEAEADDRAQADYVRAVIREQMRRGDFADVPKTIDRIFPPGAEKKHVAADAAAIFGRFDGRDLCLETWAIGLTQYGKLAEAKTVADSIEELSRRIAAIHKMVGVLIGEDVTARVLYGLLSDTILGGDAPDEDIPTPQYTDAELLEFCRWYAATSEQMPYTSAKIERTAAAAGLMLRFGFKKEADELFDKAFADVLAMEESSRIYAVGAIIGHRYGAGEVDTAFDFIAKLPEHGVNVPDHMKVTWFCAMGKFDEAIAVVEGNNRNSYLLEIGIALIAADRKKEARKILEKALASEERFSNQTFPGALVQVGMTDEALNYIERMRWIQNRVDVLTSIARKQRAEGNIADAEKTLLKAVKQVEQTDDSLRGVVNRLVALRRILEVLVSDPQHDERLLGLIQ